MAEQKEAQFTTSLLDEGYLLSPGPAQGPAERFAVVMWGKAGYAIPISFVEEVIQVPTRTVSDTIMVGREVVPLIRFPGEQPQQEYLIGQTICILSTNSRQEHVAFYVGTFFDSVRMFFTTFPTWDGGPMQFDQTEREPLGHGFYVQRGRIFDENQLHLVGRE